MSPGQKPLPIRNCKAPGCGLPIVFLANRQTGKGVPVNPDTLSDSDKAVLTFSGRGFDVDFDVTRHQAHRYLCKNREWKAPAKTR